MKVLLLLLALTASGEPLRIEMQPDGLSACKQYLAHFVAEVERRGGTVQQAECR